MQGQRQSLFPEGPGTLADVIDRATTAATAVAEPAGGCGG